MRNLKLIFAFVLVLSTLSLSLVAAPRASAEPVDLFCYYYDGEIGYFPTTDNCDLAIDKQVSVNGGDFVEAPESSQALNVTVGDTVTWKITVSNNSPQGYFPSGQVTVGEVLPNGVSLTNASASTGEYGDGQWTITLANVYDFYNQEYQEPLPATLTLTTTVTQSGLIENTASLNDYNPNDCGGDGSAGLCEDPNYTDANAANNSHSAFINATAKATTTAVVTTSSTPKAPNTGFGVANANPLVAAGVGLGGASAMAGLGYTVRRNAIRLPKIKA